MAERISRVFYGWWNVLASAVGMASGSAMFTAFSFGVFVLPLEENFGWSRGQISLALTFTTTTNVIVSPLVGTLMDKVGVKRVLVPSVFCVGLVLAALSQLTANLWHLYLMYSLLPLLGAGTLPQSYSRVIVAWFLRRRGLALGLALAGYGVGAMLLPSVSQELIDAFGWRQAYVILGASVLVFPLPVIAFLLRESPQEMGLAVDGVSGAGAEGGEEPVESGGLSGAEAMKTLPYWLILLSFLLVGIAVPAVLTHLVPMLSDRGVEPATAAAYLGALGAGMTVGRVVSGILMDRFFAPRVVMLFLVGLVIGLVLLIAVEPGPLLLLAAILIGLAMGAEMSEIAYLCSRYFGVKAFGQIYGVMFSAFMIGGAIGPAALGLYYDRVGDYTGALYVLPGMIVVATALVAYLGPYPDFRESAAEA